MVTSPQPSKAWKRIADDLCLLLERGDMQEGECLPTAAELATRYGVHRHTVRQAYLHLQELGIVRTEHLTGTKPLSIGRHHVALKRAPRLNEHLAESGGSFTAAFAASGIFDYERQTTKISARLASSEESEWLNLEPRAPVLVTNGLDCDKQGKPLQVTEAIFRADKMELLVESER